MQKDPRFLCRFLCCVTAALLCAGYICSDALAVQVTPLDETPASRDSASLGVTSPLAGPDTSMAVPTPAWTTGSLLPMHLWEQYSKRPSAFGPPPLQQTPVPTYIPHGVVDGRGMIVTPAQAGLLTPRHSLPDPAAIPVLPMQDKRTSTKKRTPANTSTYSTESGRSANVASPVVPSPMAPSVPGVTPPRTAGVQATSVPTAPSFPTSPTTAPYATPVDPTGPVTPMQPTVGAAALPSSNSPSIAAQTQGQGGVMDTGTDPTARGSATGSASSGNTNGASSGNANGVSSGNANGASSNNANGVSSGNANGNANGASSGNANGASNGNANGVSGSEVMGTLNTKRPEVLGGPAESLVIPPPGISLTPNDVPAALTAPPQP